MDTAVPCSLIISELVSNALKYAFPDRNAGEISIDLHHSQDQNQSTNYTLVVRDTGIGFPADLDFQSCSSLGLRLVNTLTHQLGGTISLDNEPGAVFTLTLPLLVEDNQKNPGDI
jgi:two-component sensor histidine kinase